MHKVTSTLILCLVHCGQKYCTAITVEVNWHPVKYTMPWPARDIAGKQFKVPFPGCEHLTHSYSQAGQDLFVLCALQGKTQGKYLEMGCWEPQEISNTYLLESQFGWTGMSFDLDAPAVQRFNGVRKNMAMVQDCTQLNYDLIIKNLGTTIDYLSIDLEPADITLQCLRNIPFNRLQFQVITFEHDKYRFGDEVRNASRNILYDAGYELVVSDLGEPACNPFEDWYVQGAMRHAIQPLRMHAVSPEQLLFV